MIRRCTDADLDSIHKIINDAAQVYKGAIPLDCWHDPYMSRAELKAEISAGVEFWGWYEESELIGVMGLQNVRDVALIRHAYVSPAHQGKGIGAELLKWLIEKAEKKLLVGTWAAAEWAIRFYERYGFRLVSPGDAERLLKEYWNISPRQVETSVVLTFDSRAS